MRAALAIALLAVSSAAQALEVARDASGGVLELSGFDKNFLTGLVLQPGTVAGSRALGVPLPELGALDANLVRLTAKFRFTDRFEFEVADQLSFLVASDPALTGGGRSPPPSGVPAPGRSGGWFRSEARCSSRRTRGSITSSIASR